MKATHLITLTERIDELAQFSKQGKMNGHEFINCILKYKDFLKQPVTLAHFVPCDKNGVPLKDKAKRKCTQSQCIIHDACGACSCSVDYQQELNEAQKSVIFEGWEFIEDVTFNSGTRCVEIRNRETKLRLQFYYNGGYDGTIGISKGQLREDNKNTLADLAAATTKSPLKLK